jgi:ribonuclease VapC
LAVVNGGPDADAVLAKLPGRDDLRISAATWTELFIVADRRDPALAGILERLVHELEVRVETVIARQAQLARQAYRNYGRGNHIACLNCGDCFAYALAKEAGAELLYVGNDFSHTDIRRALE